METEEAPPCSHCDPRLAASGNKRIVLLLQLPGWQYFVVVAPEKEHMGDQCCLMLIGQPSGQLYGHTDEETQTKREIWVRFPAGCHRARQQRNHIPEKSAGRVGRARAPPHRWCSPRTHAVQAVAPGPQAEPFLARRGGVQNLGTGKPGLPTSDETGGKRASPLWPGSLKSGCPPGRQHQTPRPAPILLMPRSTQ